MHLKVKNRSQDFQVLESQVGPISLGRIPRSCVYPTGTAASSWLRPSAHCRAGPHGLCPWLRLTTIQPTGLLPQPQAPRALTHLGHSAPASVWIALRTSLHAWLVIRSRLKFLFLRETASMPPTSLSQILLNLTLLHLLYSIHHCF